MSISVLSHRLVFRDTNTLPLDLEDQIESAYLLGTKRGEELFKASFMAIEALSRKLPIEFLAGNGNYSRNRAIAAAYYHGVSTTLFLFPFMERFARDEAKKLAARAQRLMVQMILSADEQELPRLARPIVPDWVRAITGAMSVARVAFACHNVGLQVRYPRPAIDVHHTVDLFCSMNPRVHMAIQVKTYRYSGAFVITKHEPDFWKGIANRFCTPESFRKEVDHFLHGLKSLSESARQSGGKIVPVWAFCSKRQLGLDCGELYADFTDIARR